MSKKGRILLITLLSAGFVALGGFAVHGQLRARQYERLLENSYRHAFAELTTAAGELDSALQKAQYVSPGPLQQSLYQQVYAKALAAQYALGELPYGNVELEHTAAFFAKTGDYAAALCRGNCGDPSENLAALAAISRNLNVTLSQLEGELEANALPFGDVTQATHELAQSQEEGSQELGGVTFQTIESDFPEMPSLIYDGPFSEHLSSAVPKALAGMVDVTWEEARQAAADFLHSSPNALTLISQGEGAIPSYIFSLPQDGGQGYIEVTRQGGQVLEYFQDRPVGSAAISVQEGVELAKNYLANWGFPQMETSHHLQREGSLTVHFSPVTDGVICYPDLVKVTVGLDSGKLLGYEAHGYLSQHRARAFLPPAVSMEEAQSAVPNGLTILARQNALIPTAGGTDEVLTYEFKCEAADKSHVLIYVNTQTGQQQNILLLLEDESGTLTL